MICSIKYLSTNKNVNGDLWLGLTFLWQSQIWENAGTYDLMESFEDFGFKLGKRQFSCWVSEDL